MIKKSTSNEAYKEQQLVYLWELNHEKDPNEFQVSARDVK
jgi:hypothetical protein